MRLLAEASGTDARKEPERLRFLSSNGTLGEQGKVPPYQFFELERTVTTLFPDLSGIGLEKRSSTTQLLSVRFSFALGPE